jgi:hypothetical protein
MKTILTTVWQLLALSRAPATFLIAVAAIIAAPAPAVASNETPSVRLVTPAQGGTLTPGTAIAVDASDGIFRVEYKLSVAGAYTGRTYLIGVSDQPPFTLTWRGVPSGLIPFSASSTWSLVAVAFDSSGRRVSSADPVAGIQRRPLVLVPGTFESVPQRALAPVPTVTAGAVNGGILVEGQLSAPITSFPVEGATATYLLNVPLAGLYDIHVAQGRIPPTERFLRISANGAMVSEAARFAGSTTRQATSVISVVSAVRVPLNAGVNTVTLTAVNGAGPEVFNVYTAASR